jgi:hypothetical protein
MGDEYSGASLQVFFNTVDISGKGRTVKVSESAAEPEKIDITTRGDTERQELESFPGKSISAVDFGCLDDNDGSAALLGFAINSKDTLTVYPRGKTHGYPKIEIQNARLLSRDHNVPYDNAVDLTAKFNANNTLTRTTYSSA